MASLAALMSGLNVQAETVMLGDKEYDVNTLIDREIGPGVRYTRLRIPNFPLNVNMLRIDASNPYNSIETTQANDRLYNTESLVTAAARQSSEGHKALAGANANFWCVSPQPPYSDQLLGVTYNGNLKNGKIITETNCYADQWNGGPSHTGILGIGADDKVYSGNNWTWKGFMNSEATGENEIISANKIVRNEEMNIYNSHYGTTRTFRCCDQVMNGNVWTFQIIPNCATEVYLTMDEGEKWSAGDNMTFTVKEVRENAGDGTLGDYDLAIVGRGSKATKLSALKPGDKVTLNYAWRDPQGNPVTLTNLVGGNAQVMVNGELTSFNESESYNSQIYSRTAYGTDSEGRYLYIIVIDKSTDPVYGSSAGCTTSIMCDLAKYYGCTDLTNFDAGGSAEMLVNGAIINRTTEGTPRAVANGMIVYSTAPQDNTITRIAFDDYELQTPIYASFTPRILGYNQYGMLVDEDVQGVTLSCDATLGSCEGATFTAGGTATTATLTASLGSVSVSKDVTVLQAQPEIRIKPAIVIDHVREYPMEVTATIGTNTYFYNPANVNWTLSNADCANISAAGILTGHANGTVDVSGKIGEFEDATTVTVEIPDANKKALESGALVPEEWKATGSSTKVTSFTALGDDCGFALDYTISSTRNAKVTIAKDIRLFGLVDAIEFAINPGDTKITKLAVSAHPANSARPVIVEKEMTLTPNAENIVRFSASEFGDNSDLAFYPLTFKSVALNAGDAAKTACHVDFGSMKAVYDNFTDGIESVVADADDPCARTEYFNLQGVKVSSTDLLPGMYIKRQGKKVSKVIIK